MKIPKLPRIEWPALLASPAGDLALLLVVVLVGWGFESWRASYLMPRSEWFGVVVFLHRLTVFVVLLMLWHRLCTHWVRVVLALSVAAVAGWQLYISPQAYDRFFLPVRRGLALYDDRFVLLLGVAGVFIFLLHAGRMWRGWSEGRTAFHLERYLRRRPAGRGFHAVRRVHRRVFGGNDEEEIYEAVLRELLEEHKRAQKPAWKTAQENLATYLAIPVTKPERWAARLVEAAELHYELAVRAKTRVARKSHERAERRVYVALLRGASAKHHGRLGWGMRIYEWSCRWWCEVSPSWRALFAAPLAPSFHAAVGLALSETQRSLVQFALKPGSVAELDRAGSAAHDRGELTHRLRRLALTKWMTLPKTGRFGHEHLIEDHTRLRESPGWRAFWENERGTDRAAGHWLNRRCAEALAAAWGRYAQQLENVSAMGREFALRQELSSRAEVPAAL